MDLEKFNDPEGKMAKADLYKLAKYSIKLLKMIGDNDQLQGWQQAKITKASDYISSVYHNLEYEKTAQEAVERGPRSFDESVEQQIKSQLSEEWKKHRQG